MDFEKLYIEKRIVEIKSLEETENEIATITTQINDLLSVRNEDKLKFNEKFLFLQYFDLSKEFLDKTLFLWLNKELENAIHTGIYGFFLFEKASQFYDKNININQQYFSTFKLLQLKWFAFFSLVHNKIPDDLGGIKVTISEESEPRFVPSLDYTQFFELLNVLHECKELSSTVATYQALIAIVYNENFDLTKLEQLTLISDALIILGKEHLCSSHLRKTYDNVLNTVNFFPFVFRDSSTDLIKNSYWFGNAFIKMLDDFLISKAKNKNIFLPSREFRFSGVNQDVVFVDGEISLSERDIVKFVGHLSPFGISLGGEPGSSTRMIDLALKEKGVVFDDFPFFDRVKLDLIISNEGEKQDLIRWIKIHCDQNDFEINKEVNFEVLIEESLRDARQRLGALKFFREMSFESFGFDLVLHLAVRALRYTHHYLPDYTDVEIIKDLKNKAQEAQLLLEHSLGFHIQLVKLHLEKKITKEFISGMYEICSDMIKFVLEGKGKLIVQIQAFDKAGNHAIYGVLEKINESGIQLVICNGGLGSNYHNSSKKNISNSNFLRDVTPVRWERCPEWVIFKGSKELSLNDQLLYKFVKMNSISDEFSEEFKIFRYYLIFCCSGNFLTEVKKIEESQVLSNNKFIEGVCNPRNAIVKDPNWVFSKKRLKNLEVGDVNDYFFPRQVSGNCTIHNLRYTIDYAQNFNSINSLYLKQCLEIGVDRYYTHLLQEHEKKLATNKESKLSIADQIQNTFLPPVNIQSAVEKELIRITNLSWAVMVSKKTGEVRANCKPNDEETIEKLRDFLKNAGILNIKKRRDREDHSVFDILIENINLDLLKQISQRFNIAERSFQ